VNARKSGVGNIPANGGHLIDYYIVGKTIPCQAHIREGVTTMGDECNPVDQSLSLVEAHDTTISSEEIV